jgi:hypothetical protein
MCSAYALWHVNTILPEGSLLVDAVGGIAGTLEAVASTTKV